MTPIWTTTPTNGEARQATRLLRVKPGAPIAGIITSTTLIGTYTHYWHGRTTPCEGGECDACKAHRAPRWYGYLSIWAPKTHAHAILEITPPCVEAINAYLLHEGHLRGAKIAIARANNKQNSRLVPTLERGPYAQDLIPAELDVIEILMHIWEQATTKPQAPKLADTG